MTTPVEAGPAPSSRSYVVAVYGSGAPSPDVSSLAEELGRGIARRGWILKNGGYGGTMAAAARAAHEAGGRVIGVTCRAFGRTGPNDYCTEKVDTADLFERLLRLVEGTDAFAALAGGTGTLTEVFLTWELVVKGLLPPRPICLVGAQWAAWWQLIGSEPSLLRHRALLSWVPGAAEAVAALEPREERGNKSGTVGG